MIEKRVTSKNTHVYIAHSWNNSNNFIDKAGGIACHKRLPLYTDMRTRQRAKDSRAAMRKNKERASWVEIGIAWGKKTFPGPIGNVTPGVIEVGVRARCMLMSMRIKYVRVQCRTLN